MQRPHEVSALPSFEIRGASIELKKLSISGVWVEESKIFKDQRSSFTEWFKSHLLLEKAEGNFL
jgi:dTDP-4-dehydrorhamnose 3,5-epimerase-like enzyme